MKYYTLDNIMELKPCYHRKKLEEYMKGRKHISLSGILKSKVSDANKVWLVVRLLPTDKAIEFAEWCFNSVICSGNAYTAYISYTAAKSAESTAIWAVDAAYEAAFISYKTARDDEVAGRAWNAWENYDKARRNQVNQLKFIVKEHNL